MNGETHKLSDIAQDAHIELPEWLRNSHAKIAHPHYRDPLLGHGFGLKIQEPITPKRLAEYRVFHSVTSQALRHLADIYGVICGQISRPIDFQFGLRISRTRGWHIDRMVNHDSWYTLTRPSRHTKAPLAVTPVLRFAEIAGQHIPALTPATKALQARIQCQTATTGPVVTNIQAICSAVEHQSLCFPTTLQEHSVLGSGPTGWVILNDRYCVHRAIGAVEGEKVHYYDFIRKQDSAHYEALGIHNGNAETIE